MVVSTDTQIQKPSQTTPPALIIDSIISEGRKHQPRYFGILRSHTKAPKRFRPGFNFDGDPVYVRLVHMDQQIDQAPGNRPTLEPLQLSPSLDCPADITVWARKQFWYAELKTDAELRATADDRQQRHLIGDFYKAFAALMMYIQAHNDPTNYSTNGHSSSNGRR